MQWRSATEGWRWGLNSADSVVNSEHCRKPKKGDGSVASRVWVRLQGRSLDRGVLKGREIKSGVDVIEVNGVFWPFLFPQERAAYIGGQFKKLLKMLKRFLKEFESSRGLCGLKLQLAVATQNQKKGQHQWILKFKFKSLFLNSSLNLCDLQQWWYSIWWWTKVICGLGSTMLSIRLGVMLMLAAL